MRLMVLILLLTTSQGTTFLVPPFEHTMGFNRITKFHMEFYLGGEFKLSDPQGITGAKMDEENDPQTSSDDRILTLFAVNSGTAQIIYNVKLSKIKVYGGFGKGKGEFNSPTGIVCNSQGEVYIADTGNDRIVKLRYVKGALHFECIFAESISAPRGVALDVDGNLYVTDTENSQIVIFNKKGEVINRWISNLNHPTAISIIDKNEIYNYYKEDFVIVVDNENKRIQKFNRNGQLIASTNAYMIGLSNAEFNSCALDYNANIYVTDMLNNQIHKFDRSLNYITSIGQTGSGPLKFISPRGIFIWKRFGQVFITDADGGYYYWLGVDGSVLGCYPQVMTELHKGTTIALFLTELAQLKIDIYDNADNLVRTLIPEYFSQPGEVLIVWDGRNNNNQEVRPGEYDIRINIYPTYGLARRNFVKQLKTKVKKSA
ncbi:MAG: 6-bladed beta-propeller [candidate division WOR-3 bacterium]|nr:6-bladed beta-propeller [candidate division WOR-3 bacterium]